MVKFSDCVIYGQNFVAINVGDLTVGLIAKDKVLSEKENRGLVMLGEHSLSPEDALLVFKKIDELSEPLKKLRKYRVAEISSDIIGFYETTTANNDEQAKELESQYRFVRWLTEWTIIDEKKREWRTNTIKLISIVDLDAAIWIIDNWKMLSDRNKLSPVIFNLESFKLCNMFSWDATPQGYAFWENISRQIEKAN